MSKWYFIYKLQFTKCMLTVSFFWKGSVFMIDLEDKFIRPLALNCLAYPSGLALSVDEKIL